MKYNYEVGQEFTVKADGYHTFNENEKITLKKIYRCNTQGDFINKIGTKQTIYFEDVTLSERYVAKDIQRYSGSLIGEIMNFHKECYINYCLENRKFEEIEKII